MKRLLPLFGVVAVDLLGFGIIIPLVPFIGVRFGLTPAEITLVLASYSLCQFVAAPLWGRLSDRFGRRPILMTSMLGASASYVLLALADSGLWLVASRALGGAMAGNLSAAFAYATDVTSERDRARGLGLIGAAVGLGFTLGPALGGQLSGSGPEADLVLPAIVAASLSGCALLAVWLLLPESHAPGTPGTARERFAWRRVLQRPVLAQLVLAALLITTAHATLESIIALWALDRFGFGPYEVGLLFLLMGGVLVIMQGAVVGHLTKHWGELRVAVAGIGCYIAGLALLAFGPTLTLAVLGGLFCGVGAGAYTPSLSSLVSRQADPNERGVVMGTYQSSASLARIIGPGVSGAVYGAIAHHAPFVLGILIALPAIWLVVRSQRGAGAALPAA